MAVASALATAPAVLVTLVATVSLLGIRAWVGATGLELTRRVVVVLDGAIVTLVVLFFVLVTLRFLAIG